MRFEQGVFQAANLAQVARIAEALRELPGVSEVFSLQSAPNLVAQDEDIEVSSFTTQAAVRPDRIEALRGELAANPIYANTLISQDGKDAAFALTLTGVDETSVRLNGYPERMEAVAREVVPGAAVRVTVRMAGMSDGPTPRPSAYVSSFSVIVRMNTSGRAVSARRSDVGPSTRLPSISTPAESIDAPPSRVRQRPTAS